MSPRHNNSHQQSSTTGQDGRDVGIPGQNTTQLPSFFTRPVPSDPNVAFRVETTRHKADGSIALEMLHIRYKKNHKPRPLNPRARAYIPNYSRQGIHPPGQVWTSNQPAAQQYQYYNYVSSYWQTVHYNRLTFTSQVLRLSQQATTTVSMASIQ